MIGILGGTFDPVHNGHIHLAEQALAKLPLSEIHFLPCAQPVHRGQPVVNAKHRELMIKMAIRTQPQMRLNRIELERDGPSYMIDTLVALKKSNPQQGYCLLLGQDAFNSFSQWKAADQILNYAHLIVCDRPGVRLDRSIYSQHWVNRCDSLTANENGHIFALSIEQNACSSTLVREQLRRGQIPVDCLAPIVYDYILNERLYEKNCESKNPGD